MNQRRAGVLLPVFSLPGEYGCGTFGDEARAFIDRLADNGFSVWQVLPFCLPDECHSPYKSFSAFSVNPYFVDPVDLFRRGLLTKDELDGARQKTPYLCEYDRLDRDRWDLLSRAADRWRDRAAVEDYLSAHPQVAQFCEFMGRRAANGGKPYVAWTEKATDERVRYVWAFTQYTAAQQWRVVREHAKARGVSILGDMPMYVAEGSADVYANPAEFQLDEKGFPTAVAGVPPDYFSADGQLWGNPLYRFDEMKKNGFRWWRERIRAMGEWFDGVRIDHFRAIEAYYRIPLGKSPKEGKWVKGPGMALVKALREEAADMFLLAEDLGDITDGVRKLLKNSGLPGMRVLQFAFLGGEPSEHLPHRYDRNCVAYTGTHDNNTLLGYMFEQSEDERRRLLAYCGYEGADFNTPACYHAVFRTVFASAADTVILPLQDLLLYGSDTRINTPGRSVGNWAYRVTEEQIGSVDWAYFAELIRTYER